MRLFHIAFLALLVSSTVANSASLPSDAGAHVEAVAPGVYAIIHRDATDEWPHGNTGVVVGENGLLVIDSTYLPSRARADIALIRKLTDQPVRYLVNTHWHFDHNNGAIAYQQAYPGLQVISERETRNFIELNARWWARMSTAPNSARRKALQELEAQLSAGKSADGKALESADRAKLAQTIQQRRAELDELATLEVVTPNLVFDNELVLDFDGRQLILHDWGRANSPHDVTVYLPTERVLFTGDILVQSPAPYTFSSWPVPWVEVLLQVEHIPATAIVPGHGPVLRDHVYTRQVRNLFETVIREVTRRIKDGETLEQIQAAIDANALRAGAPEWKDPALSDEDWKLVIQALVERTWRGVRGQGG